MLGFVSTSREPGGNWLGSGSWSLSSLKLQPEQILTTRRILRETSIFASWLLLRSVSSNAVGQRFRELYCAHLARQFGSSVLVLENAVDDRFFRGISQTHSSFRCCCSLLPKGGISHELKRLTEEMQKHDLTFLFERSLRTQFFLWT